MNKLWHTLSGNEALNRSKVAVFITLALFITLMIIGGIIMLARGDAAKGNNSPATLTVSGKGTATTIPDVAKFSFRVVNEAETVSTAQQATTQKTNTVLKKLKDNGIKDTNLKTINYSVSPRHEYREEAVTCKEDEPCPEPKGKRVLVGYEVSQQIEVMVRDLNRVGDILELLGSNEVSNINGPRFTIDDRESVLMEARTEAINTAKEKAKKLASELDVRLGQVVDFTEKTNTPWKSYARMESADAVGGVANMSPDIPSGEEELRADVEVTYKIK